MLVITVVYLINYMKNRRNTAKILILYNGKLSYKIAIVFFISYFYQLN
jgi:hypothetical protein